MTQRGDPVVARVYLLGHGVEAAFEVAEFVGPGEEDYTSDVMRILTASPLATALMHKKIGDHVEFQAPRGITRFEITNIEET